MASPKKKATARTGLKFKDIKSKSNPKGGISAPYTGGGGGPGGGKVGKAEWLKI
jgi:hypothetical protein